MRSISECEFLSEPVPLGKKETKNKSKSCAELEKGMMDSACTSPILYCIPRSPKKQRDCQK